MRLSLWPASDAPSIDSPECCMFEARVEDGYIGDFAIDRYGDATLNTIGVYRIENGRLRFETAIAPPPELLARR
jgi:hypothetical protein